LRRKEQGMITNWEGKSKKRDYEYGRKEQKEESDSFVVIE